MWTIITSHDIFNYTERIFNTDQICVSTSLLSNDEKIIPQEHYLKISPYNRFVIFIHRPIYKNGICKIIDVII